MAAKRVFKALQATPGLDRDSLDLDQRTHTIHYGLFSIAQIYWHSGTNVVKYEVHKDNLRSAGVPLAALEAAVAAAGAFLLRRIARG